MLYFGYNKTVLIYYFGFLFLIKSSITFFLVIMGKRDTLKAKRQAGANARAVKSAPSEVNCVLL